MSDGVVAENGAIIEAGGIYLTPNTLAKVISMGATGKPAPLVRLTSDLVPVVSPVLWVKMCYRPEVEPPEGWLAGTRRRKHRIRKINVDVFLAWGPPDYPIRVGSEAVTAKELAACVED